MSKDQFLALKIDVNPVGRTALNDAVRFACRERMSGAQDFLRVMVLVSDGDDTHSRYSLSQAIASAQKAGAIIFTVDTGSHHLHPMIPGRPPGVVALTELAEKTGGEAFIHLSPESLDKAFAVIEQQIASMYLISFISSDLNQKVQYHSFHLKAATKTSLRIRAPKGYYIDAASN